MSFTLPTTGTDPKISTKSGLEAAVDSAIESAVGILGGTLEAADNAIIGAYTQADTAIMAALASGGTVYLSEAAGLAGTSDGQTFMAFIGADLRIYLNDGGVAVSQGSFEPTEALIRIGWKVRPSEPFHTGLKVKIGISWYSPDWVVTVGAGQSNELGNQHATDGDKTGLGVVYAWNGSAIVEAVLGAAPFQTSGAQANNKLFHAAHRISVEQKRPVLIFMTAVGGSGINDWDPSVAGNEWANTVTQVTNGLLSTDLWGYEKVNLFSFGWGEDAYDLTSSMWTMGSYRLPEIVNAVKDASWSDDSVFFAASLPVQEIDGGQAWQITREWVYMAASGKYSNFAVVSAEELTLTWADAGLQVHFNGASLQKLGYRVADIFIGKATGVTSSHNWSRDNVEEETFNGESVSLIADLTFDDNSADSDTIQVVSGSVDFPVLFVSDDAGTVTRSGSLTSGGTPSSSLVVQSANRVRVKVYVGAAAFDNPVKLNIGAGEPSGDNALVRLYTPKNAPLDQIYITGASKLSGRIIMADLARTLKTFRVQSSPLLDFSEVIAPDIPPELALLNLNGCIVPRDVQEAITAENVVRGGAITVTSLGVTSASRETGLFSDYTTLTTAISSGFLPAEGSSIAVGDTAMGSYRTLIKDSTASGVAQFVPSGYRAAAGPVFPQSFAADPDLSDNTTALNAWLAFSDGENYRPNWGDGEVYVVTGNLTDLLTQRHTGRARIEKRGLNFITEPSFEDVNNIPWSLGDGVEVSTEQAHSGTHSLKVRNTQTAPSILSYEIVVTPGETIHFSFWAYATSTWDGSDSNSRFRVGNVSDGNSLIGGISYQISDFASTDTWELLTNSITIPAGCTLIDLRFPDNGATSGAVYIDDIVATRDQTSTTSGNIFYVGEGWQGDKNVIHVSPTGSDTNDGLSVDSPVTLAAAFDTIRMQGQIAPSVEWQMTLAAGTYGSTATERFENWPTLDYRIRIIGGQTGGVNNVIIDGTGNSSNWLRALRDVDRIGLYVEYVTVQNFGDAGWYLDCDGNDIETLGVNFLSNGGAGAHFRGGYAELIGPAIAQDNVDSGFDFQSVYGATGKKGQANSGYLFKDNGGAGMSVSRDCMMYQVDGTFEGNVSSISLDKNSRVRRQGNTHTSWTGRNAITVGPNCTLDYDPADLDSFPGLAAGKTAVFNFGGHIANTHSATSPVLQPHNIFAGSHNVTGTADWFDIGSSPHGLSELSPFRKSDTWMYSEAAQGKLALRFSVTANSSLGVKLAGDDSSNNIFEFYLPSTTVTSDWLVEIDFVGPVDGSNYGRYIAKATRESLKISGISQPTVVILDMGSTDNLGVGNTRGTTGAIERWRLNFKMANTTDTFSLRQMATFTAGD